MDLQSEARVFVTERELRQRKAMQRVALLCNCGIEIDRLQLADPTARLVLAKRLKRLIERERIRGSNRHWSYDLNRHIALKQALDDLAVARPRETKPAPKRRRQKIVRYA